SRNPKRIFTTRSTKVTKRRGDRRSPLGSNAAGVFVCFEKPCAQELANDSQHRIGKNIPPRQFFGQRVNSTGPWQRQNISSSRGPSAWAKTAWRRSWAASYRRAQSLKRSTTTRFYQSSTSRAKPTLFRIR